jgi:hypothetical protein
MDAICEKFGLPRQEPLEVKQWDNVLLRTEQRDLMPIANDGPLGDNDRWHDGVKPLQHILIPRPSKETEEIFLLRFKALQMQVA